MVKEMEKVKNILLNGENYILKVNNFALKHHKAQTTICFLCNAMRSVKSL